VSMLEDDCWFRVTLYHLTSLGFNETVRREKRKNSRSKYCGS